MPITGKEIANASNVKAAFKKLFSDTSLARKLRKNMGLGDTLGPLPVENGGTGVTDNTYIEKGFANAVKDCVNAKIKYGFAESNFINESGAGTISRYFPIDDQALCGIATVTSGGNVTIGINLYDIDRFYADNTTSAVSGTYTITNAGAPHAVNVVAANGKKNKDGSTLVWVEFVIRSGATGSPVAFVYDVSITVSSTGAVSGSHTLNKSHGSLSRQIENFNPYIAFFQSQSGVFATICTPKKDNPDYNASKLYFFECAKNGAFSYYESTAASGYKEVIWPYLDDGSVFMSEGVYMSLYRTSNVTARDKIMSIDVDNTSVEVHAFEQSAFSLEKNWFVGTGFRKAEKAYFAKENIRDIGIYSVSKDGTIGTDGTVPIVVLGKKIDNIRHDLSFYGYDENFGRLIFFADTADMENIHIGKYGAFFSIDGNYSKSVKHSYSSLASKDYHPMKMGSRVFLFSRDYSSGGYNIKIVGF